MIIEELERLIAEYENDIKCIDVESLEKKKILTRKKNKLQDILVKLQNTASNIEYKEIKPCARLGDCSLVRIEGKCLGGDKCHVYKSV